MRSFATAPRLLCLLLLAGAPLAGCTDELAGDDAAEVVQAITAYQVVTGETAVDTLASKQLSVACPAGLRALGAGWGVLDATGAILDGIATYFEPSFDGRSWLVNARNLSAFQPRWKLQVRVLCGGKLVGYQVVARETAVDTSSVKQLIPECPFGQVSLGAGWSVLDSTSAILDGEALHFAPNFDGASWIINARISGAFSPGWKLRGRLVCVNTGAITGYEVLLRETAVDSMSVKQLEAGCSAGKHATSLGWAVLDATSAILDGDALFSEASFDGTAWLTNARNLSGFSPTWKLRVGLICTN